LTPHTFHYQPDFLEVVTQSLGNRLYQHFAAALTHVLPQKIKPFRNMVFTGFSAQIAPLLKKFSTDSFLTI